MYFQNFLFWELNFEITLNKLSENSFYKKCNFFWLSIFSCSYKDYRNNLLGE